MTWRSSYHRLSFPAQLVMLLISILLVCISACWAKPALRTANDIAKQACETFAEARERQLGISKEQWCALRDNLDPFLSVILAAERKAGISNGTIAPPNESADDPAPPAP